MHRIALGIEYDGSSFHGWQRQEALPSVQDSVETAISKVAAETIRTTCAGRTDKGVHATHQVIHFDTQAVRTSYAWVAGTNANLPSDIRILWSIPVSHHFNARRSAISRRYRYIIYNHPIRPSLWRQYVAWQYKPLDVHKMHQAAQFWVGEHDFSSFRAAECQSISPIRQVFHIDIQREGQLIILEFKANAFLHHMIRNMVGALSEIGKNQKPIAWAKSVLEAKTREAAGITAAPEGLYLDNVEYPLEYNIPKYQTEFWLPKYIEES